MTTIVHILKSLYSFVIPGGLVLLAALAFLRPRGLPPWTQPLVYTYAYIVFGAGILLGWYLERSRILLATVVLALANGALLHFGASDAVPTGMGRIVFNAIAILVPLNFLGLSLVRERSFQLWKEMMRLSLVILQLLVVWWICLPEQAEVAAGLEHPFVDPRWTSWTPLAQPALLAFAVCLVLQASRFILYQNPVERGFVWALLAAFVALQGIRAGWSPTNFLATAALMLVIAAYEATHAFIHYDEVTGVRRWDDLKAALRRLRGQYAIAMVDVDHLKQVNEQFGHHVGDQVLRHVAAKITNLSANGEAFCYSGGKFTVLFRGKSVADALPHLEALRKAVETSPFTLRDRGRPLKKPDTPAADSSSRKELSVTISIGVAERDERKAKPDQVVKAAERALFRAKSRGRNQVAK